MLTVGVGGQVAPVGLDLSGVPAPLASFPIPGAPQPQPLRKQRVVPRTGCPVNYSVVCLPEAPAAAADSARPAMPTMITMPAIPPRMPTGLPDAVAVVAPEDMTVTLTGSRMLWRRSVRKFAGEWGEALVTKVASALRVKCDQQGGDLKIETEDRDGVQFVIFSCWVKPYQTAAQVAQPAAAPTVAGQMPAPSITPSEAQAMPMYAPAPSLPAMAETSASIVAMTPEGGSVALSTKEDAMSEFGVLDLSGAGAAAQMQRQVRQQKRLPGVFKRFPPLVAASAAMSTQGCRMGRNASLVMANEAFPNRAATIARDKVQSQNTGVPSAVGASTAPGEIRAVYSPESFAAEKGWMPGAGVAADVRPPSMGVRMSVTGSGGETAGLGGCGCGTDGLGAGPAMRQRMARAPKPGSCPPGRQLMWSTVYQRWVCVTPRPR